MEAIVDHCMRFMSYDLRPGSWSIRKMWKASFVGSRVREILPQGGHFVGDTGYTISATMLTPYQKHEERGPLSPVQRSVNYRLSSTRMVVEQSFGLLKNRFRLLRRVLKEKVISRTSITIVAAMVVHNLLVDLNDDIRYESDRAPEPSSSEQNESDTRQSTLDTNEGRAKRDELANACS